MYRRGKWHFIFLIVKPQIAGHIYSVSAKETALECCDSDRIEFIPPLDYVLEGKNLGDTAFMTDYFEVSRRVKDICVQKP